MSAPGGSDEDVTLRIGLRNEVSGPAAEAEESLRQAGEEAEKMARDMTEAEIAARRLARAQRDLALANEAEAASARSSAHERLNASRIVRDAEHELGAARREVIRIEEEETRSSRRRDQEDERNSRNTINRMRRMSSSLENMAKKANGPINKMFSLMSTVGMLGAKFLALIAMAPTVAGALGVIGAAALATGYGLSPLLGMIAVMPAMMLSAVQGMGVFKAATSGFMDAVKAINTPGITNDELQKTLQKLTPMARQAAIAMAQLSGPHGALHELQQDLQENFFAQFAGDMDRLPNIIAKVAGPLRGTATILGRLVDDFIKLADSPGFGADMQTNLKTGNFLIEHIGKAALKMADAFNHVMAILQPFFQWFGRGVLKAADGIDKWVHSASGVGNITVFFNATEHAVKRTWEVVKNFGIGFYNIIRHAGGVSTDMSNGLLRLARRFRAWTESAKGQNSISQFFDRARRALHLLGSIVGQVWHAISPLFHSNAIITVLDVLSGRILPALLGGLHGVASDKLHDAFQHLVDAFANMADALGGKNGVLTLIATLIDYFATLLDWVTKLPKPVLVLVLSLIGITVAIVKIVKMMVILGKALVALGIIEDANPFVLIATAVALLVIGLTILVIWIVKHWSTVSGWFKWIWQLRPSRGIQPLINIVKLVGEYVVGTVQDHGEGRRHTRKGARRGVQVDQEASSGRLALDH